MLLAVTILIFSMLSLLIFNDYGKIIFCFFMLISPSLIFINNFNPHNIYFLFFLYAFASLNISVFILLLVKQKREGNKACKN